MGYPESWKCPNCQKIIKENKKCPECGFKYSLHYPSLWSCPKCGELVHKSRSCPKCNYPNELHYPELWHCPKCNELIHSSTKCPECGYESRGSEFEKKKVLIQKKLRKYGNVLKKRKSLFLIATGLITLLGLLIIFTLPSPRLNYLNTKTVNASDEFNLVFKTDSSASEVTFELTSPRGEVREYNGVESETGTWIVSGLELNESGNWSTTVYMNSFSGVTEISDELLVKAVCLNHSDCENDEICCFGSCTEAVCYNNSDCDDNSNLTIDLCTNAGTCEAKCGYEEVGCSLYETDGVCPEECHLYNDADCTNCPSGLILCNGDCHDACYSNSDCDDNNSSTIDTCKRSSDPCSSYCEHSTATNPCKSGEILVNGSCIEPVCFTSDDCEDLEGYAVKCWNKGTINSYCYYQKCSEDEVICNVNGTEACVEPACVSNEECDEGEPGVFYYCMNHGTCDAYCTTLE